MQALNLVPFILFLLSVLQALGFWLLGQSVADRREMRGEIASLKAEIADVKLQVSEVRTHVGVDGNGILSRLDQLAKSMDEVKRELSEMRGAAMRRATDR